MVLGVRHKVQHRLSIRYISNGVNDTRGLDITALKKGRDQVEFLKDR